MDLGSILIDANKVIELLKVASSAVDLAHGKPLAIANSVIQAVGADINAHAERLDSERQKALAEQSAPPATE